jgi:hypothetical protein
MADVQGNQTPDNRGSGVAWGIAAGLLVVILVIVFLIIGNRDGGATRERTDVDITLPAGTDAPSVDVPDKVEVNLPDKVEVNVPDKVQVDVKTSPPAKTAT